MFCCHIFLVFNFSPFFPTMLWMWRSREVGVWTHKEMLSGHDRARLSKQPPRTGWWKGTIAEGLPLTHWETATRWTLGQSEKISLVLKYDLFCQLIIIASSWSSWRVTTISPPGVNGVRNPGGERWHRATGQVCILHHHDRHHHLPSLHHHHHHLPTRHHHNHHRYLPSRHHHHHHHHLLPSHRCRHRNCNRNNRCRWCIISNVILIITMTVKIDHRYLI